MSRVPCHSSSCSRETSISLKRHVAVARNRDRGETKSQRRLEQQLTADTATSAMLVLVRKKGRPREKERDLGLASVMSGKREEG
ncbi:hypothetical protein E2562_023530 [Oryza meyeriana var. granulata]|uniref:Uncharacterized protein n=1 Tax=Oryza meyeriana var. granulata TaxID=110450 RepID=A0A6G1E0Q1_9ORYZ|nr:hypothetical protein E2562_023530 [Oryza meyeriana var. granulata]